MKNTSTIAVVQDDLMYRTIIKKLLQASGLFSDILVFDNGLSMLSYLQEHATSAQLPDIILLDMSMPIMDGWSFLEEYEKLSPVLSKHSSIFIHTASLFEEDLHKARQYSSVTGYIPAPFRISEFKTQLEAEFCI